MNDTSRSLVCAIRGPIILITVGVLFAMNNLTPYGFSQTWPVLLIVVGLLSLVRRGVAAPMSDTGAEFPPAGFPPPERPRERRGFSPYNYPPPPPRPTSYRQSPYNEPQPPASGPAKGGFGTSAPPRPAEPGSTPPGNAPGDAK